MRHDPWEALQLSAASDFTCAGAALAAPPAETLSGQIMRHNALASMKRLGCSGIESSRDPGNTPVKVLPDLVRIVPLPTGARAANTVETKTKHDRKEEIIG